MNRVFDKNLFILEELFGKEEVSVKLDRLKYIFENTEEKWAENLKLLKNSEIRYLLICEAPPFSEIEPPKYFYNYHNKNFNKEIWKTFYPNEIFPNDKEYYFTKLVEVGFLIIDTLPYSMFFQNKRKNKNYYNLLKNSFEWFIEKLNQEELRLSKNLKIAFGKDEITVKPNGILDNLTLHYPNEAARHKLLDVVGDLALIGTKIQGKVIANKPGHFVNTQFAKKMAKIIKIEQRNYVPVYDLNLEPLMDIHKIMSVLPHRPPFLLIDRIIEMSETHVVGMKNVTMNENFFVGHFPEAPVMPGVLIVEAMAQTGGILVLSTVPDPENYLTYFMKIDNVKFKHKVLPGDTLIFKCDLITPIRRGICHMQANAYANGKLVAEAELMAQIAKKQ